MFGSEAEWLDELEDEFRAAFRAWPYEDEERRECDEPIARAA